MAMAYTLEVIGDVEHVKLSGLYLYQLLLQGQNPTPKEQSGTSEAVHSRNLTLSC